MTSPKQKIRARRKARHAISKGDIVRPDRCEECGEVGQIDAHHPDYDRPLDVEFLCKQCHYERHSRGGGSFEGSIGFISGPDLIRATEASVSVEMVERRTNFGRTDVLIRPVEGDGEAWVRADKVEVEDDPA